MLIVRILLHIYQTSYNYYYCSSLRLGSGPLMDRINYKCSYWEQATTVDAVVEKNILYIRVGIYIYFQPRIKYYVIIYYV